MKNRVIPIEVYENMLEKRAGFVDKKHLKTLTPSQKDELNQKELIRAAAGILLVGPGSTVGHTTGVRSALDDMTPAQRAKTVKAMLTKRQGTWGILGRQLLGGLGGGLLGAGVGKSISPRLAGIAVPVGAVLGSGVAEHYGTKSYMRGLGGVK